MVIQAPQRAQTRPGLPLSLNEHFVHIPRGLSVNLVSKLARISGKNMRSKSR
jgi:hypothetical protein